MIVTDPRAARILNDPLELQWFSPFVGQERTVNDVALETNTKPNTMFARVRRYLELGLVRVVREEPREGRALRVYRSSADVFFVPFTLVGDREEASVRWFGYWERELARAFENAMRRELPHGGARIYRDANGVFTTSIAPNPSQDIQLLAPDAPAIFSMFHDGVFLDFQQAKQFQQELDALVRRYIVLGGGQRYALRINFVPMLEGMAYIR